ncbi:glucose/arabinose dehydrogenase [Allocatelliglobosispora scoriae]|uniref:Glucose/arabinose dehydrogenase n=1 Tax=Allocatelliglobosispora scoriae TaxID=643052 RepID=A0A841BQ38_9ACTN|nr:ThuA domain-containing protein [Allocatelliglobosispora scoriae]MBB5868872.1 glucose/arabinose dehydrogenase [Allocatelliglobosispora scoriae]
MLRRISVFLCALIAAWAVVVPAASAAPDFTVLVFSKTAGFRHDAIPAGITAIQQLGTANNFAVEATEDAAAFTDANLARFKVVIWLSTTGDVLNDTQQAAFERYIRGGGGYVGVHAAADTEYTWPWYGKLVGAYFESHPAPAQVTVRVADRVNVSTATLPQRWSRFDELYNYQTNPRGTAHILATLDETTYSGGGDGFDHPISWCQNYDGGKSWYTGLGHTIESYSEANFRTHLLGGIRSVAGVAAFDCGATVNSRFQQVTLAKGVAETGEPMGLTVLPNRGVLHTSREGVVRFTDVDGNTKVAMTLPVYTHDEEGMQSIKADPAFATNRWVYIYYAPPLSTPPGDAPPTGTPADFAPFNGLNRISRFVVKADNTIDPASAVTILDVPTSRGQCCHVGGDLDFDGAGNLYLSTGDDTNPFDSSGFTPIDERAGRNPNGDAQRTAGNTNDLRGKVLRIKPSAAGGYTIPAGNMFAPGTANTKPEIYAMGFRNPFRMSVDKATGIVYLGDYGPDAGTADPARGPAGQVEFARITTPGFYGWPYCSSYNTPYVDFTFPSGPSGAPFNCTGGVVNNSPNNTGLQQLPPAKTSWLPYVGSSPVELGGGGLSPMGGPVYRYDPNLVSDVKFPQYYDGTFFAGEFGRRWIKNIVMDSTGAPLAINPFPWSGTQVMDMEFGPDGALYVLDYGTGWFGGDASSAVYRIEYATAGRAPIPTATASATSGLAPLTVNFSSAGSYDPDGNPITYAWDFTSNGSTDSTAANPSFTYTANGAYTATLTARDSTGKTGTASVAITVGNTAPSVTLTLPVNGQVFTFGDLVPYSVTVTDAQDGTIDCNRVKVSYILGHDTHGHPQTSKQGCSGTIQTVADGEHGSSANVFGVFDAEYTDSPVNGVPALTTHAQNVTQPRIRQAEHFNGSSGIQIAAKASANGGNAVGYIDSGDWLSFKPYALNGVTSFSARVASAGVGGTLSLRTGSPTGPLAGSVAVAPTGGWETWATVTGTLTPPTGTQELFLVFTGPAGSLFDLDEFTLGAGTVPPQTGTDLALNRPATASSVEGAGTPASGAFDGNAATRWASAFADPQWIQVDLGSSTAINRVKLTWEAAYGSAYQIQTSDNGTAWTTIKSVTGGDGGVDDLTGLTGTGRYVRMNGTARGSAWGYSLFAFEVYGGGTTPPVTSNLALNQPVTASSVENAGTPASAAVDGVGTTRWSSLATDPQWIRVDLGQTRTVNRVKLTWEAAYATAYQVQISPDGTTWTTIQSVTGGNGAVDDLTGLTGTGRYVRINGTTRATGYGYSLWEFEVYGS